MFCTHGPRSRKGPFCWGGGLPVSNGCHVPCSSTEDGVVTSVNWNIFFPSLTRQVFHLILLCVSHGSSSGDSDVRLFSLMVGVGQLTCWFIWGCIGQAFESADHLTSFQPSSSALSLHPLPSSLGTDQGLVWEVRVLPRPLDATLCAT